VKTAMPL